MFDRRNLPLPAALVASLFLTACAWVPRQVSLKPDLALTPINIGDGFPIVLQVLDRRPRDVIGYRGLDSENAKITATEDPVIVVRAALASGLARKGFKLVPSVETPGRLLTIELRQLDYKTGMDFWKGSVTVTAQLHASTSVESKRVERLYTAEKKESTHEAPTATTNDRLINGILTEVLVRFLEDADYLGVLAQ